MTMAKKRPSKKAAAARKRPAKKAAAAPRKKAAAPARPKTRAAAPAKRKARAAASPSKTASKAASKAASKTAVPPAKSAARDAVAAATAADPKLAAERLRRRIETHTGEGVEALRYDLGLAYRELGLFDDAIRELRLAANDTKLRADALANAALCARDKGDRDGALSLLKEAVTTPGITPKQQVTFWYEIAATLEARGDTAKAALAFRKAFEIDPTFRDLRVRVDGERAAPKKSWRLRPRLRERAVASSGAPFVVVSGDSERDGIGGAPILREGQEWPVCQCGERMVLFFQLDVRAEYGLPFAAGSHLLAFMCWKHGDANLPPAPGTKRLPDGYGGTTWRFLLNKPGAEVTLAEEPHLKPATFQATEQDDGGGVQGFKVGGAPSWAQDPERYRCSCGADMAFVCQVPANFRFLTREDQPEQPGWFSSDDWVLFLGNETYVFACTAQCRPDAVWPVNQN